MNSLENRTMQEHFSDIPFMHLETSLLV